MDLTYESVDADCFFDFVRGTLLPQLQPFDGTNPRSVVILDKATAIKFYVSGHRPHQF